MLQLISVTKQYLYGAKVLGAVNMTIKNGEIVALLGDEQSGKTTFVRVAGGGTDCEGEVLIDGAPILKKTNDVIIVFDDLAMFEYRSVYYNLAYPLIFRGYSKQDIDIKVKECANRMGIVAYLYEKVKKLSLIEKKRVAIARLFLRDVKVILVDDITKGLCKQQAAELWQEVAPILIEKAKQGVSVIYATRERDEALSIADRIAVLHYGEIKQVGSPQEIAANPSNIWAAQALDCDYHFEKAKLSVNGDKLLAEMDNFEIDLSHLKERIVNGYQDKEVYLGWHSFDYDVDGERCEDVQYAMRCDKGYVLTTSSGLKVHSDQKANRVGTLPKADRVCVFDLLNENSVLL